jgi:calcineurin-like phosphoesterase family protein
VLLAAIASAAILGRLASELPSAALEEPQVRFVVLGHLRGDRNGEPLQNLDEVVGEVARTQPDLVFLLGDLIWGDVDQPGPAPREAIVADWERLDAALARIGAPIWRVPGNHDICDVVTRDIWRERYGVLPRAVTFERCRFLLLSSAWIPEDGDTRKHPQNFIRGADLGSTQIAFVRSELEEPEPAAHVFVMMHHLLWWEERAAWWSAVHPQLASHGVRAVFGGDYGPMKFSHERRDGVDYLQTSIENRVSTEMLRGNERSRLLSSQLDNFLLVTVDGPEVRYEVRTVGALTTGKFTPQRWREVNEYDRGSLPRRLYQRWNSPERMFRGLLQMSGAAFATGVASALVAILALQLLRRRRR